MPEAGTETLTPTPSVADPPNLNGSTQLPNLNASVNLRKPRSKIARLPEHVRDKLNTILAEGGSYPTIIHWLSGLGYPGFNKTNLHSWRFTGFEKWLERKTQEK